MKILLLSNGQEYGQRFLEHALDLLREVLPHELLFVPYARPGYGEFTSLVEESLHDLGTTVIGLHTCKDPASAVRHAEAIFAGGGNTFLLLKTLAELDLVGPISDAIHSGAIYIGSSAGTNIACPTIRTANDMPIVDPGTFKSLGLVPFQINPHYLDPHPHLEHMGETRRERILQFLECNDCPVIGLREGSWIYQDDASITLGGKAPAVLFRRGQDEIEVPIGSSLQNLMASAPVFG